VASLVPNAARQLFGQGGVDWEGDDIRALLTLDTHTPLLTHAVVADVVADELTATDYARQLLPSRFVSLANPTVFSGGVITWAGLGGAVNQTIGGVWIFVQTGSDATAPLLVFIDSADALTQDINVVLDLTGGVFTWASA